MEVPCFLLLLLASTWAADDSPVVNTANGEIRGSTMISRLGRRIYAFRGIPFAKPPIGYLRFKPPQPPNTWNGILDATKDGPSCPPTESIVEFPASEDCLILNVYTTELSGVHSGRKKPVIVFYHPGGWYSFTSNSHLFGPQYLLDQDVVLVVPNYRLSVLGFINTNDGVLSGNNGLKDQVAALRWVKDNIAAFGGDPDCVTIAGYSAGSASVMLHLVSPMSRGLFHRAMACSGSALSPWVMQVDPFANAHRFARLFNCSTETSKQIKDCLMEQDAIVMADRLNELQEWAGDNSVIFGPSIEVATEGERFLTQHPLTSFLTGNFSQVPLITGITADEFGYASMYILTNETLTRDMNTDLDRVLPIVMQYERNTPRSHYITSELRELYFGDRPIDNSTADELSKMLRDGVIAFGEDMASKIISKKSKAPLYYYRFSYRGPYSFVYKPDTTIPFGVVHHDDLQYWFYISSLFPFFEPTDPEVKTVERLTKLYANFAKTGNPTPAKTDLFQNVIWEPFTPQNLKYLDIGDDLQMKVGLYQTPLPVWTRLLYPQVKTGRARGNSVISEYRNERRVVQYSSNFWKRR